MRRNDRVRPSVAIPSNRHPGLRKLFVHLAHCHNPRRSITTLRLASLHNPPTELLLLLLLQGFRCERVCRGDSIARPMIWPSLRESEGRDRLWSRKLMGHKELNRSLESSGVVSCHLFSNRRLLRPKMKPRLRIHQNSNTLQSALPPGPSVPSTSLSPAPCEACGQWPMRL